MDDSLFDQLPVTALISISVIVLHICGMITALHAIRHVRTAQGAVAWAICLVLIPYFTLIPYLFLGSSRFLGYVDARRLRDLQIQMRSPTYTSKKCSAIHKDHAQDWVIKRLGQRTVKALSALAQTSFVSHNAVHLLINGKSTFEAIFSAIDHAKRYIMVQFFVVRDDTLGQRLQQALLAKAAAGVRVYFLYDGIGCSDLSQRYVQKLRAGGVEIHQFATRRFINRFQLNFRNHRKILIVDGARAFVGGHNAADEYLGIHPNLSPWRDTHIDIQGPVVSNIQTSFIQDWYWITQQLLPIQQPKPHHANMHCLAVPSGPADQQETCLLFFIEAIHAAKHCIWISSPYFIPDEALFAALRLAVMRGVEVRILLPSRCDHYMAFQASVLYSQDAICAGIQVFRYQPGFLHQKVLLIDNTAAAIGSANLDNRSFRLNFEMIVLTVDTRFAKQVCAMLEADFAQANPVEPTEIKAASFWQRISMHIARLFSPLL
jgi:cardiolipin synthase